MQKIDSHLLTDPSNGKGMEQRSLEPASQDGKSNFTNRRGMSPALSYILADVQRELGLNGDGSGTLPADSEVEELIERVSSRLGFELTRYERDEILEQVEKERKPFGVLQELVDDPEVTDIIVTNYSKISVQQGKKNLATDLAFPNEEHYEAFVERLLQRAHTTYSTKKPIADGMIGSFARIHAVHKALCESGPYLTIRLNRFSKVTLRDLTNLGLAPTVIFDYLKAIIRGGHTVLIVGEVGTGKTTLARALASSIPQEEAILVIEDTPEIRLEHPHVRYITTRDPNTDGAGRISPSECIRAGMRMAMNRIIFGEMRDAEAAEAFIDVCASGHPGLSTIHARTTNEAIVRLELFLGRAQKGATRNVLLEQIVTAVQVIVHVNVCPVTGRRRITEVKEIGPVADGVLRQRDIFRYQDSKGIPAWRVLNKVSAHREDLERGESGVYLNSLPALLELNFEVLYKETALRNF